MIKIDYWNGFDWINPIYADVKRKHIRELMHRRYRASWRFYIANFDIYETPDRKVFRVKVVD